jgi:alkylation response protein AidB-like acyl-CoA dehydrogenase
MRVLDYHESDAVARLRSRLRDLVAEHVPTPYLGAFTSDPDDFAVAQQFCKVLAEGRLLAIAWPEEYGGGGASYWEQTAFREEMWAAHEPRGAQYMGINWVGPILMRHGTEDQISRHLPPISSGEVIWCQGFSEPEAGSDLPALRTRATRIEGGWRIDGQKVWTSYARMAQWCFVLARTGQRGTRKDGISVFLTRMDQPGVEVRPIATMLGEHHLNEVYFDGAFVPDTDVLGEVGDGWRIISEVIAYERVGIARYARCERLLSRARTEAGAAWENQSASLRSRWAVALAHTRRAQLLAYRVVDAQVRGDLNPATAAVYRIAVTTLDQEVGDVLMDLVTDAAFGGSEPNPFARAVEDHWRYAQASTVASGSLEMQKQLLARSIE